MGLAEEAGKTATTSRSSSHGIYASQRRRERDQRDAGPAALTRSRREQRDPAHRLPARALQVVVELGSSNCSRSSVAACCIRPHADAVREQIAEQTLVQRGSPTQGLAEDRYHELRPQQQSQPFPGGIPLSHGCYDLVHDQLADPEHRERHDRAHGAQHEDGDHVAGLGGPYQPEEPGQMFERLKPLTPARWRVRRLSRPRFAAAAVGVGTNAWMRQWRTHGGGR